jgi:hypothetical protein
MASSPQEDDPSAKLNESVRRFVHSQTYINLSAEQLSIKLEQEDAIRLRKAASVCIRAFRIVTRAVADLPDTPIPEKREIILTLMEDDDISRVEAFNALLESDFFEYMEVDHGSLELNEAEFIAWMA